MLGNHDNTRVATRYGKPITGRDFTAKDFRTWAGTVLAAMALREVMVLYMLTDVDGKVLRKNEVVRWKRKFDW